MNYYHRYCGDYIKKTLDLSMVEDGAYTRLLDWMYANERDVPHEKRYTLTRCQSPAERRAVDMVLSQYFKRVGDAWTHERTQESIQEARPRIEAARENGKKGGRPKGSKNKANGIKKETQEKPNGFSETNPDATQGESSPYPIHQLNTNPPTPLPGEPGESGFDRFWDAWPSNPRKVAKAQCLAKWKSKHLAGKVDQIVAHVEAMARSEKWREKGGEFVPAPLVYLNQERWQAPVEFDAPASGATSSAVDETQTYLAQLDADTRAAREANARRKAAREAGASQEVPS